MFRQDSLKVGDGERSFAPMGVEPAAPVIGERWGFAGLAQALLDVALRPIVVIEVQPRDGAEEEGQRHLPLGIDQLARQIEGPPPLAAIDRFLGTHKPRDRMAWPHDASQPVEAFPHEANRGNHGVSIVILLESGKK